MARLFLVLFVSPLATRLITACEDNCDAQLSQEKQDYFNFLKVLNKRRTQMEAPRSPRSRASYQAEERIRRSSCVAEESKKCSCGNRSSHAPGFLTTNKKKEKKWDHSCENDEDTRVKRAYPKNYRDGRN